jgi:hypothetical protein
MTFVFCYDLNHSRKLDLLWSSRFDPSWSQEASLPFSERKQKILELSPLEILTPKPEDLFRRSFDTALQSVPPWLLSAVSCG